MNEKNPNLLSPNFNQQSNLPNATAALVLGILSIVLSFCYGLFGLSCGIIGLILANKDRRLYLETPELYSPASFGQSNGGRICSIIGIIISSLILFLFIILLLSGRWSYGILSDYGR